MTTTSRTQRTHPPQTESQEAKHHCSTQMAPCPYEVAKPLKKPSVSPRRRSLFPSYWGLAIRCPPRPSIPQSLNPPPMDPHHPGPCFCAAWVA